MNRACIARGLLALGDMLAWTGAGDDRRSPTSLWRSRGAMDAKAAMPDYERALAHALLNSASDAVVATDREGAIRHWNPGAERIFGFAAAEAIGRSLDLIIPEPLRARHWEGYREVMATGESRYGHGDLLSVPGLAKDGSRISLEFTVVPLNDASGRIDGVVAVMRDVTKRFEEMRALKKKLAAAAAPGS